MAQHTQNSRLELIEATSHHGYYLHDEIGRSVCDFYFRMPNGIQHFDNAKAWADRIVACVNACAGIDIDYLQSPDNLATYARNMALQRDEAHKQLFEIRALVGAQTEDLIQDAIKRLIAERDQCKADFEAQFNV